MIDQRTVALTGAASGIGLATAQLAIKQGWKVVLLDHDRETLRTVTQDFPAGQMLVCPMDVRSAEDCLAAREQTIERFGGCDVLINNAGIMTQGSLLEDVDLEVWQTNLWAQAQMTRLWWHLLKQSEHPHVISISSIFATLAPYPFGVYSISKAALQTYTAALHREIQPLGGFASTLLVGFTRTPLFEQQSTLRYFNMAKHYSVSAETVAQRLIHLIHRPKQVAFVSFFDRFIVTLVQVYPSALQWILD